MKKSDLVLKLVEMTNLPKKSYRESHRDQRER